MSNKLASSAKKMISKVSSLQTFTASPMKKNIEEATPKYVQVLSSSMKELETIKQMDTEEKLLLKKQIKAPPPVFISFNQSDVAPEPDAISPMPQNVPK